MSRQSASAVESATDTGQQSTVLTEVVSDVVHNERRTEQEVRAAMLQHPKPFHYATRVRQRGRHDVGEIIVELIDVREPLRYRAGVAVVYLRSRRETSAEDKTGAAALTKYALPSSSTYVDESPGAPKTGVIVFFSEKGPSGLGLVYEASECPYCSPIPTNSRFRAFQSGGSTPHLSTMICGTLGRMQPRCAQIVAAYEQARFVHAARSVDV